MLMANTTNSNKAQLFLMDSVLFKVSIQYQYPAKVKAKRKLSASGNQRRQLLNNVFPVCVRVGLYQKQGCAQFPANVLVYFT